MSTAVAGPRVRAPEGVRRLLGGLRPDGRPLALAAHAQRYGRLPAVQRDRSAVRLAGSALRVFDAEFGHHERAGRCTGGGAPVLQLPVSRARAAS